ncbi:MAG: alkaline phosphatase family protein [Actinomycetota bacterium]|nr:alkaline phosphatase family protein [Actinomycetota bacterium]
MLRRLLVFFLAVMLLAGVAVAAPAMLRTRRDRAAQPALRMPEPKTPVQQACGLEPDLLVRIWRGHQSGRSEDITAVPAEPNYLGSFAVTSHSGPWDYLQRVPLVAYGPGRVPPNGQVETEATLADVYATAEDWTQVELEDRAGRGLTETVNAKRKPPKLLVFVMWDGVGRNVLERWPNRWPNLARLEREGTSYANATVGSSPSITPSTHATLGTGAFPNEHGVTGIQYRDENDKIAVAQAGRDVRDLELSTFADDFDRALDNQPLVGTVAYRIWHIPMMGHGAATRGGDRDHLAIIGFDGKIHANYRFYERPSYLEAFPGFQEHVDRLDQKDGLKDGEWLEHPIAEEHDNPAWADYQTDMILEMLEREGYGADATTDLFFTNYKMTDIVGHQYSMDSEEMGDVLEAQDRALGRLVDYLDENVRDYALLLSADHGHTPSPERSGAWPISQNELESDLNERFGVAEGDTLTQAITAVGPFLDAEVLEATGTTTDEVATFMNGYTIQDNWPKPDLPPGYEDRGAEPVFEAAFPSEHLDEVMQCAFGSATPPGEE